MRSAVFFFQAEDGIRDATVTGVQTCALPIYCFSLSRRTETISARTGNRVSRLFRGLSEERSEERRVGKSVDLGGRRIMKKRRERKMESRVRGSRIDGKRRSRRVSEGGA